MRGRQDRGASRINRHRVFIKNCQKAGITLNVKLVVVVRKTLERQFLPCVCLAVVVG